MLFIAEVDAGYLLPNWNFTSFITKDDRRETAIEAELKGDKDESDGIKKGGKKGWKKKK